MNAFTKTNKNGFISILGIIILCIIIILALGYYRISLRSVVESPTNQDNINYVQGAGRNLWDDYLKRPAEYLWNDVFKNILWKGFINNMERIRDGQPTVFEEMAPVLPQNNGNPGGTP